MHNARLLRAKGSEGERSGNTRLHVLITAGTRAQKLNFSFASRVKEHSRE